MLIYQFHNHQNYGVRNLLRLFYIRRINKLRGLNCVKRLATQIDLLRYDNLIVIYTTKETKSESKKGGIFQKRVGMELFVIRREARPRNAHFTQTDFCTGTPPVLSSRFI